MRSLRLVNGGGMLVILVVTLVLILGLPLVAETVTPNVVIVAPDKDCILRGGEELLIMVMVSNLQDVVSVVVMCDDKGVGMLNMTTYSVTLTTSGMSPGTHILRAFAFLKNGEKVGAEPVAFSILETATGTPEGAPVEGKKGEQTVNAAVDQPKTGCGIKEGTAVVLLTTDKIDNGHTSVGTIIRFIVAEELLGPNSEILVEKGANASGTVTESKIMSQS